MFVSILRYKTTQLWVSLAACFKAAAGRLFSRSAETQRLRTRTTRPSGQFLGMIVLVLAAPLGRLDLRAPISVSTNTWMVQAVAPQGADRSEHSSIFDGDDRFPILDPHPFPWSAVVLVRTYWSAEYLVGKACSGWMIGPSSLVTAAHCIYDHGYPHHVIVKPAMNSDDRDPTPFGTCNALGGVVPQAWIQNRSKEYDYGVYRLDCTVGNQTGTLGFKVTQGDGAQMPVQLTGYPNDKQGRRCGPGSAR